MIKTKSFYSLETLGGILLFLFALLAMLIANSRFRNEYYLLLNTPLNLGLGELTLQKTLLKWVNDGLMAIYFLLVGLEIKREIRRGVLSHPNALLVPIVSAFFGLLVPVFIFLLINHHDPIFTKGWAIPSATDIAFSIGVIRLLFNRASFRLKILLTAIAIFDDIAAILIIGIYYTHELSFGAGAFALLLTGVLILLNRFQCRYLFPYLFIGILLWIALLKSGVHATIAGFLLALTIPDEPRHSTLTRLEIGLHPWVAVLILPLFAFFNAGMTFHDLHYHDLLHPLVTGIVLGLFLGKPIGIGGSLYYFVRYKQYLADEKFHSNRSWALVFYVE